MRQSFTGVGRGFAVGFGCVMTIVGATNLYHGTRLLLAPGTVHPDPTLAAFGPAATWMPWAIGLFLVLAGPWIAWHAWWGKRGSGAHDD